MYLNSTHALQIQQLAPEILASIPERKPDLFPTHPFFMGEVKPQKVSRVG